MTGSNLRVKESLGPPSFFWSWCLNAAGESKLRQTEGCFDSQSEFSSSAWRKSMTANRLMRQECVVTACPCVRNASVRLNTSISPSHSVQDPSSRDSTGHIRVAFPQLQLPRDVPTNTQEVCLLGDSTPQKTDKTGSDVQGLFSFCLATTSANKTSDQTRSLTCLFLCKGASPLSPCDSKIPRAQVTCPNAPVSQLLTASSSVSFLWE